MYRGLGSFILGSALLWGQAALAGEAGRVVFVSGQAHGAGRALALGDAVQEGDQLQTGADGYIYIKTVDSGFFILRPSSQARVVSYHIDAQNPANSRVKLELLSGVARTISGQGVKQARQNFRFNTPVAAIGVRGTDFTVYTDQQVSRVAVTSGGVVVSGFGGACGPEGAGPCEGAISRELFANQSGQLLQIQRGQVTPQILRANGNTPDNTAPPRSDEPAAKAASGSAKLSTQDVSLEAQKSDVIANAKLAPRTPESQVPVPTPVMPPVVTEPKPPETIWGRWQQIADMGADTDMLEKLRSGAYLDPNLVGPFFLSRQRQSEFVMPREGTVGFNLVKSEAYIREGYNNPVAARVENPFLRIDFGARSFATGLDVVASNGEVKMRSEGGITANGVFISDAQSSNAFVQGFLGGADAKEAAYVFSSTGNNQLKAFGGTSWSR